MIGKHRIQGEVMKMENKLVDREIYYTPLLL